MGWNQWPSRRLSEGPAWRGGEIREALGGFWGTPEGKDGEIWVRRGNSKFEPRRGRGSATGVFSRGYVENKGDSLAPQVGFGPEYSIDNIGSCWFYCNASNVFVQKWPLCTTELSHVTVFQGLLNLVRAFAGNARTSVESSDSRVTHSTTPFSV